MLYDHYMLKNSKNNKSPKISLFYTILVFESNVNEDYYHIYLSLFKTKLFKKGDWAVFSFNLISDMIFKLSKAVSICQK
jgi:hypothetical protein